MIFYFSERYFLVWARKCLETEVQFLSFDKHPADEYVTLKIFQHLAETIFFLFHYHMYNIIFISMPSVTFLSSVDYLNNSNYTAQQYYVVSDYFVFQY